MIKLSEYMLTWAKRVEIQRAQATVINSLHELKNVDTIPQLDKGKQRERQNEPHLQKHLQEEESNTAVRATSQDGAQHIERSVKNVTK